MLRCYKLLLMLATAACFAQKPAEIGIVSDNDLYTSPINDQYYTNGIEFFYRYLGNPKNAHVAKKTTEFRAGQYLYNPQSVRAADIRVHDRPFAGYLFAEAGLGFFYNSQDVLKLKFQGGIVGPEAMGEEFQKGLHKLLHYPAVHGWHYQITTTPAIQAGIFYSKYIGNIKDVWDFQMQGELNAGTIWNSISAGPMVRYSLTQPLQKIYRSALHGAALEQDKEEYNHRRELFLYANPTIQYMQYDTTIQGSPFNDNSPVTWPLIHWRFNAEAGIKYRTHRWSYSYSFHYRGKECINRVITGFYYGSIRISHFL